MPGKLKHMELVHSDFSICTSKTGGKEINWKGDRIATLPSVNPLRNSYKGGCFIVGCGPSIAEIDLYCPKLCPKEVQSYYELGTIRYCLV